MDFQAWLKSRESRTIYDCSWARAHTVCSGGQQWAERMQAVAKLDGHGGCVNSVLFSHHGQGLYTYTGSDDQCIAIWKTDAVHSGNYNCRDSEHCKFLNTSHTNNIFYVRDIPHTGGSELVTCAADGKVILHSLPDSGGHYEVVLARHRGRAHRIALTPHSPNMVCTAGEDGVISVMDLRDRGMDITTRLPPLHAEHFGSSYLVAGSTEFRLPPFLPGSSGRRSVYSINLHPDDPTKLIAAGESSAVNCYDTRKLDGGPVCYYIPREMLGKGEQHITAVKYNYNGGELIASYSGGDIYSFDSVKNQTFDIPDDEEVNLYQRIFHGHRNVQTVKQVSYHGQKSELVVTGCDSGHVFMYSSSSGDIVKVLKADERGAVNCLASHPLDDILATSGLSHYATFFRPAGSRVPASSSAEKERIKKIKDDNENTEDDNGDNALAFIVYQMMVRSGRTPTSENIMEVLQGFRNSSGSAVSMASGSDSGSESGSDSSAGSQASDDSNDSEVMSTRSADDSEDDSIDFEVARSSSDDDDDDDDTGAGGADSNYEQRRIAEEVRAMVEDEGA